MAAWAYIAHKDGKWAGLASASLSKKELRKFLGDFASDGFLITTVESREEYDSAMSTMTYWGDDPAAPKRPGEVLIPDLLEQVP